MARWVEEGASLAWAWCRTWRGCTRGTHERVAPPPLVKITNLGTKSPVLIRFELNLLTLQLWCVLYLH
jgi:hypothetical protein